MVARAAADRDGAHVVQHLCALGSTPEWVLLRRAVPVAVLFAMSGSELRACHAAAVRVVVEPVASIPGAGHTSRLQGDLLLLPQGVLSLVLLVATGLRGAGCATAL